MWPHITAEDIIRHVDGMCSKTSVLRGQLLGEVVLPLPTGTDWMEHSNTFEMQDLTLFFFILEVVITVYEPLIMCYRFFNRCSNYDRVLAHTIETHVINWTSLIQKIVKEDSSDLVKTFCNPCPNVEFKFWASRLSNIQNIYNQVFSPSPAPKDCFSVACFYI